ncbi:MAG: type II toxin-antitoxin system VapC family toxin [Elusimicrobia bacterium]|nr:type II toxin-antitoxin system VapC family toxin [Elusimicrobiota bacterium]
MAAYLLDTSVIIDVLNARNDRASLLETLLNQGHVLACCAVNISEVYAGLRPKEERSTRAFLESLEYLDITWDIARHAGLLKREHGRKGLTLALTDCTLAAVALGHGCTLITDNAKDFPMKELALHPLQQH